MEMEIEPIWGLPASSTYIGSGLFQYHSERTGRFATMPGLDNYLKPWRDHEKAKLTSWILDHNRAGDTPVVQPKEMSQIRARRNLGFSEKVDRFLLMLEARNFRPGDDLPWLTDWTKEAGYEYAKPRTMLWIEAASDREFDAFAPSLIDAGMLTGILPQTLRLAPRAYARMDELRSSNTGSDQGFVAMWFDPSLAEAYTMGIEPALINAGFRSMRIDRKEHNNKIDDEILAEIRRSRFVVADFTCEVLDHNGGKAERPRGGVYYEAGFANGLNIPVIWCVREDQLNFVHFDTRQFNHIVWSTPEDLRERLKARIAASIGWGPLARR